MKLLPIILENRPSGNPVNGVLTFVYTTKNPTIGSITAASDFTVVSWANGARIKETYPAGTTSVSVVADALTPIRFLGQVTKKNSIGNETQSISINSVYLQEFTNPYSTITEFKSFVVRTAENLKKLILKDLPYLDTLEIDNAHNLEELALSGEYLLANIGNGRFERLQKLTLKSLSLSELDLSLYPSLTYLELSAGSAFDLDLSKAPNLEHLELSFNNAADLTTLTNLTYLSLTAANAVMGDNYPELEEFLLYSAATTRLPFGNSPKLKSVTVYMSGIEDIDISATEIITSLSWYGQKKDIKSIKARALNSSVATTLAGLITSSQVADGVVYLNDQDTYYSTIADAATAKGWTIEAL